MTTEDAAGRLTIAVWHRRLRWAVDELAEKLTPEQLRKLDVRAGEHLAAILTTAFLLTAPTKVDDSGGVDLWFDLPEGREPGNLEILPAQATSAAFEVKSLPGGYRKFDALINRDTARGVDPTGRALEVRVQAANDVLHDARPWLLRAQDQLHRKVSGDGTSMNAFLVIHPFDHLSVESLRDYAMGPYLEPLENIDDLDTVWVLWPPYHLTMWSRANRQWINLMFDMMNPDEQRGEFPALQTAEMYFFTRTGHTEGSPYLFTVPYGETDPSSS